ncbi:MAG: DDE-type integrase/transposase/recombinase, partial [Agrobacterium sp.]|uniref:DDE-type integrase/transposase/recombinase n=1 Tax=Agrobacterium sp. TaxID=361 RepID=UPI004037DFEA
SGSHGYDSICVFVDRLSKMVHLVPCKESMDAPEFAQLFIDKVFVHHGLPSEVVSDRGSLFVSKFWQAVCKLMGMKHSLTSSYHPQSNGQVERYNKVLEEMLRHYISPTQRDWPKHLSFAEFAINNSWQESIKSTPFLINYGQSPVTPVTHELPRLPPPMAQFFSDGWEKGVQEARRCMKLAQSRQSNGANPHRKSSDSMFQVGDRVLLSTMNLRNMVGKARKLLPRYVGPFRIEAHVGRDAVKLTLPPAMSRIHPVFHVSLLRPYEGNFGRLPPTELGWLDDSPQYEVERIVNHRHVRAGKAKEYLVKWKGYDDSDNTWEPASNLANAPDCVNLYKAQHGLL